MSKGTKTGIIGSGSWATALAKILTDNGKHIHWWIRNEDTIRHMQLRHHNKHYLTSVYFDTTLLEMYSDLSSMVAACDQVVLAVPSAFLEEVLAELPPDALQGKKVISAIKGLVPGPNILINEYLFNQFGSASHIAGVYRFFQALG